MPISQGVVSTDLDHEGGPAITEDTRAERSFEWSTLGLFAALLAMVTCRHEMWKDEIQAWLLARDSHSLSELFRHLRYEGHPALWYLFLYWPAHISWNPISMQVINYLFALTQAWLIVSARRLHWSIRLLSIFSYFIFFQDGVVARSYTLATLLVTAALRCIFADKPKRKLAVLLFALAVNTHVFAAAIAAPFLIWEFVVAKIGRGRTAKKIWKDSEFWFATVVMLAALLAAWLTARPAIDEGTFGQKSVPLVIHSFLRTAAYSWNAFLPVVQGPTSVGLGHYPLWTNHSFAAVASIILALLITASLRTMRARSYFISSVTFFILSVALTIHFPRMHRLGLLFLTFLLALLIDAYGADTKPSRQWLPGGLQTSIVIAILSCQAFVGFYAAAQDCLRPYSAAKDVSIWLKQRGLDKNPLMIPYQAGAVVGYQKRPSAYLGNWGANGSFAVWNTRFNEYWTPSEQDLSNAQGSSPLPVVAIAVYGSLDREYASKIGLVELKSFSTAIIPDENFTVYEWTRK